MSFIFSCLTVLKPDTPFFGRAKEIFNRKILFAFVLFEWGQLRRKKARPQKPGVSVGIEHWRGLALKSGLSSLAASVQADVLKKYDPKEMEIAAVKGRFRVLLIYSHEAQDRLMRFAHGDSPNTRSRALRCVAFCRTVGTRHSCECIVSANLLAFFN